MKKHIDKTKVLLLITIIINFVFFILGFKLLSSTNVAYVKSLIAQFGVFAPLAYVSVYTVLFIIPFNPLPKNVITYFALVSFGPLWALLLTLIADMIGVSIDYGVGRWFHQFIPKGTQKNFEEFSKKNGWWALVLSRLLPATEGFAGADLPSYAAGIVKMPFLIFIIATFIPWLILDSIYFYSLNFFLGNKQFLVVFAVLVGLSLVFSVYKLVKK
jgi:uncharacterized membrane protein YdjX (TVP38/TMEM64 family)